MSKPRRRGGQFPQKIRCKATNRWGEQCAKWAMKGSVVCNKHGGAAPQVRRKAQERIAMAQDDAASTLIKFMSDKTVPIAERRRCAEFLLNYEDKHRAVPAVAPWEAALETILVDVTVDEVVEAEIVEADEPAELPAPHPTWDGRTLDQRPPTYPRGTVERWQG